MPTITSNSLSTDQTLTVAPANLNVICPPNRSDNFLSTFDPYDEDRWFFGFMSRADATDLLSSQNEVGAFLVRESTTAKGDLVLSVKENNDKISHYIINRLAPEKGSQVRFKIGDHIFCDIPTLLAFYKSNNLDDTPLRYAATSKSLSMTNFRSHKRSFTRDYLLEAQADFNILSKCMNNDHQIHERRLTQSLQRKLPLNAVVIQSRVPNAYDRTALALKEGQIVRVTKIDVNGCWEGEVEGRVGHFPFNYVKFIDEPSDSCHRA